MPTKALLPFALFAALSDPVGVLAHRRAAFERITWVLADWDTARAAQADVENRMVTVLDELGLTEAVGLEWSGSLPYGRC